LLEREAGRTIILLAPAGYGKTTLARQWIERVGGAWVSVSAASGDIPVLARDVAAAVAEVTGLDMQRVEIALQAARTPGDQASMVARTILSQVAEPVGGWIVLDDYQHLTGNAAAEELVGRLERSGKFRFLVTSRERPKWATSRRRVHLETVELGSSELALDETEVAQLLPPDRRTAELRRQARGWPAVIGLAAHARLADVDLTADALSEQLYDYLAEELFECAGEEVRGWLTALAVLPPLRRVDLAAFLGDEDAAHEVVGTGLAYETDGYTEVHPLARDFLRAKLKERSGARAIAERAFELALGEALYDTCFEIATTIELDSVLDRLITESYSPLIETGRIGTLVKFTRYAAARAAVSKPLVDLLSADLALADGSFERTMTLGQSFAHAVPDSHPLAARGLLVAGRAAQLAYKFEDAYVLYSRALQLAVGHSDRSDAACGVCIAAIYIEDGRGATELASLEALGGTRPKDLVKLDTARTYEWLFLGTRRHVFDQDVAALADSLADPWVRTSWSYLRANALVLNSQYEAAAALVRKTLHDLGEFRLVFATPHVKWTLAAAELGMRRFSRCERFLRGVENHQSHSRDLHSQLNARALRARLALAQQQPPMAVELTSDDFVEIPSRAMYGEYLSTRALALAVAGDGQRATEAAVAAERLTASADVRVLSAAARAVVALFDQDGPDAAHELLGAASETGVWDGVVCAVRASPALLSQLVTFPEHRVELREVLIRSQDGRLARSAGLDVHGAQPSGRLTQREREVMEHVAQGKRNADIAKSLFITIGTVKRHLDSAYRKLGAHNRAESIARYAEMVNAESVDSDRS